MKSERISPFWVNGYQPFSAANYEGSDIHIDFCSGSDGNVWMAAYGAEALMKALEKGRLKGKLKEIAAKLHPEDNPVVVVVRSFR